MKAPTVNHEVFIIEASPRPSDEPETTPTPEEDETYIEDQIQIGWDMFYNDEQAFCLDDCQNAHQKEGYLEAQTNFSWLLMDTAAYGDIEAWII